MGDVSLSMSNKIVRYVKHNPSYKVILYSNTKSATEGHLLALFKKMLVSNSIQQGDVIALTGDSGLMMKIGLSPCSLGQSLVLLLY
jgi:DNA helicase TIP49 (TBP-interacting protein)